MPLGDIIDGVTDTGETVVDEGTDRVTDFGSGVRSGTEMVGSGISTVTPTSRSDIPTSTSDLFSSARTGYSGIDSGVRGGVGFAVDNPLLSLQDDIAGRAMVGAMGTGQLLAGEDPDATLDDVGEGFAGLTSDFRSSLSSTVEGTPADNPVTSGFATLTDALVAHPARTAFGTVTGVDPETGETEFRPSALEAGELALIGAGGAATRGSRGLLSRLGGGDDVATAGRADARALPGPEAAPSGTPQLPPPRGAGAADDAATTATRTTPQAASDVTEAATSGGVLSRVTSALPSPERGRVSGLTSRIRGAGRTGDDAATAAARTGDDAAAAAARTAGRTGDDAATAAARTGDDAASAGARTAGRAADDATDGGGLLSGRNIFGVSGRTAAIGGGGLLAGGIGATLAGDMLSSSEVPDEFEGEVGGVEYAFQQVEPLPATDEHPQGADLYVVYEGGVNRAGYWVVLGADLDSGDVLLLDSDGTERTAQITSEQLQQGGIMEEEA